MGGIEGRPKLLRRPATHLEQRLGYRAADRGTQQADFLDHRRPGLPGLLELAATSTSNEPHRHERTQHTHCERRNDRPQCHEGQHRCAHGSGRRHGDQLRDRDIGQPRLVQALTRRRSERRRLHPK